MRRAIFVGANYVIFAIASGHFFLGIITVGFWLHQRELFESTLIYTPKWALWVYPASLFVVLFAEAVRNHKDI